MSQKYTGCSNFEQVIYGTNNHIYTSCSTGIHKIDIQSMTLVSINPNAKFIQWGYDGFIYVGIGNTLNKLDPSNMSTILSYSIPNNYVISSLKYGQDSNIYIGTEEGYLYKIRSLDLQFLGQYNNLLSYPIRQIEFDNINNHLYIIEYIDVNTTSIINKINALTMTSISTYIDTSSDKQATSLLYYNSYIYVAYVTFSSYTSHLQKINAVNLQLNNSLTFSQEIVNNIILINNLIYISNYNTQISNICKIDPSTLLLSSTKRINSIINSITYGLDNNFYYCDNEKVKKIKFDNLFIGKFINISSKYNEVIKQNIKTDDSSIPIFREYIKHNNTWKLIFEDDTSGSVLSYNYGYVCGGMIVSSFTKSIDRMEFPLNIASGNTTSYITDVTINRGWSSGNNSSEHGYVHGGLNSTSHIDTCDKYLFTMSMGQLGVSGKLSTSKRFLGANNNSLYGYVCGGANGTTRYSSIDRFLFPLESSHTCVNIASLSALKEACSSTNSSQHGYTCGGGDHTGVTISTIDRFLFPLNGGSATSVGQLTQATWTSAGNNSNNASYVYGGWFASGSLLRNSIQKLSHPFDGGSSTLLINLLNGRRDTACNNSSQYGFVCGGRTASGSTTGISSIERLNFSTDMSQTEQVSNLSASRYACVGVDSTDFISQFV